MSGCKHCGAEKNGTAWGEETYACGMTSGYPVDVRTTECLRRENAQISADRDRRAAELARVRRNHLRRMLIDLPEAQMRAWWYKQEGTRCGRDLFTSDRQDARWDRFEAALRAALAQTQDGTTEGRG